MKSGSASAEESTSVRARVSIGRLAGSERRACKAASFADLRAAERGGEGQELESSRGTSSTDSRCNAEAVDWQRILARLEACSCICWYIQHGLVRGESNCPLHRCSRNPFMSPKSCQSSSSLPTNGRATGSQEGAASFGVAR